MEPSLGLLAPATIDAGFKVEVEIEDEKRTRSTVSFHTFPHPCASLLFEAGRNVKQVQAWLGHAGPGFTLSTYIHLTDAGVGSAAFLDQAIVGRVDIERSRGPPIIEESASFSEAGMTRSRLQQSARHPTDVTWGAD